MDIPNKNWKTYTSKDNGKTIKAIAFIDGMEDGVDTIHNKKYIMHNGIQYYVNEGTHLFIIDGETKLNLLVSEVFLNNVE